MLTLNGIIGGVMSRYEFAKQNNRPVFRFKQPENRGVYVVFEVGSYLNNGNLSIELCSAHTGEIYAPVTRNLEKLKSDHEAYIKNNSECTGMARFLVECDLGFLCDRYSDDYPLFWFHPHVLKRLHPDSPRFKETKNESKQKTA